MDIKSLAAAAAATGPDMTKAQKGGGGAYVPPAAGPTRLRFIGYVETGKHEKAFQGQPKIENEVVLVFELSGPKHAPKVLDDGTKVPYRVTVKLKHSLNEKAGFFKLFKRMNYKGTATHMSQLLGEAFRGTIVHSVVGEGDQQRTYVNLKDDSGFTIAPPRYEDPETGEQRELQVDEPLSPLRLFVWNSQGAHLKAMWDSIFIDGTAGEGENIRSLNVFQDQIKAALNFADSPIAQLLSGADALDLPETAAPAAKSEQPDPLDAV